MRNQSSKMIRLNQPLCDRLYIAPFGPFSIHVVYKFSALYTMYGGSSVPSAEQENITDVLDFVESIILSGWWLPLLTNIFFRPGSSVILVSS